MDQESFMPWRAILLAELFLALLALLPLGRPKPKVQKRNADTLVEVLRWLGLLPAIAILGIEMLRSEWNTWARFTSPAWLRGAGAVTSLLAIALIAWSILALGKPFSGTRALRHEHQLVRRGPYRWVRHPDTRDSGVEVKSSGWGHDRDCLIFPRFT